RPARFRHLGVDNPAGDILASAHRLLDGYGWQPLHDDWDYDVVYRRVGEALADWPVLEIRDGNHSDA
ncbi:MAG: hypothetical protein NTU83_10345, partial [Candidatus Hydrogenedentes bacterium]|nr:hypothetical protein [Candidatus Hydrogenedentota bacterium]